MEASVLSARLRDSRRGEVINVSRTEKASYLEHVKATFGEIVSGLDLGSVATAVRYRALARSGPAGSKRKLATTSGVITPFEL